MSETYTYLLALGSNRRTAADGLPRDVIAGAIEVLQNIGVSVPSVSPIIETAPVGPSQRRYANAAAVVETIKDPSVLIAILKGLEQAFGQRRGQRWSARALDLDILLWSGGIWASPGLLIPHPRFRERDFVLGPAKAVAADWRDPVTGLSVAQLHARLTRPRPVPR